MKKILSVLLSMTLILSFQSVYAADSPAPIVFTDVDASTQLGRDIYKLVEAGIINGNGDGTFAPHRSVTRAELCKMVNNIWKYTVEDEVGFYDVTPDKWYYSHVRIGKKAGYINGFEDGTFRGDSYVTREQACAIVVRVAKVYDFGIPVTISDNVSPWALTYVTTMLNNRLVNLEEGNRFRATENMTRAELATVLVKFLSASQNSGTSGTTGNDVGISGSGSGGGSGSGSGGGSGSGSGGGSGSGSGGGSGSGSGGSSGSGSGGGSGSGSGGGSGSGSGGGSGSGSGGSSGGSSGGNTGDDTDMTQDEIISANQEMLLYFKDILNDLQKASFAGIAFDIVEIVKNCLTDAIELGETGQCILSRDFVYEQYDGKIKEAKTLYYGLPEESQSAFISSVTSQVKQETIDYLIEVFM